jgi:hypothetical protein
MASVLSRTEAAQQANGSTLLLWLLNLRRQHWGWVVKIHPFQTFGEIIFSMSSCSWP